MMDQELARLIALLLEAGKALREGSDGTITYKDTLTEVAERLDAGEEGALLAAGEAASNAEFRMGDRAFTLGRGLVSKYTKGRIQETKEIQRRARLALIGVEMILGQHMKWSWACHYPGDIEDIQRAIAEEERVVRSRLGRPDPPDLLPVSSTGNLDTPPPTSDPSADQANEWAECMDPARMLQALAVCDALGAHSDWTLHELMVPILRLAGYDRLSENPPNSWVTLRRILQHGLSREDAMAVRRRKKMALEAAGYYRFPHVLVGILEEMADDAVIERARILRAIRERWPSPLNAVLREMGFKVTAPDPIPPWETEFPALKGEPFNECHGPLEKMAPQQINALASRYADAKDYCRYRSYGLSYEEANLEALRACMAWRRRHRASLRSGPRPGFNASCNPVDASGRRISWRQWEMRKWTASTDLSTALSSRGGNKSMAFLGLLTGRKVKRSR